MHKCFDINTSNFYGEWRERAMSKSSKMDYALLKDKPQLEDYLFEPLTFLPGVRTLTVTHNRESPFNRHTYGII